MSSDFPFELRLEILSFGFGDERKECFSPDTSNVTKIGSNDESDGDDVVGEHLPVILPSSFDVERHELMEPEGESANKTNNELRISFFVFSWSSSLELEARRRSPSNEGRKIGRTE